MNVQIATSTLGDYRPREQSSILSRTDRDGLGRMHEHISTAIKRTNQLAHGMASLARQTNRRRAFDDYALFPFRIYQMPPLFHTVYVDPSTFWRTYWIRAGMVRTTDVRGVLPTGTDQVDQPYDTVYNTLKNGTVLTNVTPTVVPDTTPAFYFWIEINSSGASAVIRWGTDPTASSYTDPSISSQNWTSSNSWATWPAPDAEHVLIGIVDTSTGSPAQAFVRQIQVGDVLAAGAGSGGVTCSLLG